MAVGGTLGKGGGTVLERPPTGPVAIPARMAQLSWPPICTKVAMTG